MRNRTSDRIRQTGHLSLITRHCRSSERFRRLGLRNFVSAFFARPSRVVVPEILHGLAEMLNDVAAIEVNVFDKGAAVVAIENDVLLLARRTASLYYDADCVGGAARRMRDIRRNRSECLRQGRRSCRRHSLRL